MSASCRFVCAVAVCVFTETLRDLPSRQQESGPFNLTSKYLPMMSKTEQLVASAGAMLRRGRGQMCSRAEYEHSLNAMTEVLHPAVSSGEQGTVDHRSSHECDV